MCPATLSFKTFILGIKTLEFYEQISVLYPVPLQMKLQNI